MWGNLVNEYFLLIHPLLLGSGRRLFSEDAPLATLRLVDSRPTAKGVVTARYRPADRAPGANEEHGL